MSRSGTVTHIDRKLKKRWVELVQKRLNKTIIDAELEELDELEKKLKVGRYAKKRYPIDEAGLFRDQVILTCADPSEKIKILFANVRARNFMTLEDMANSLSNAKSNITSCQLMAIENGDINSLML